MVRESLFCALVLFFLTATTGAGAAPTQLSADAVQTHEVRRGETLWGLAERYLHDSSRWPEILEKNKDRIVDPRSLRPGQVLMIPVSAESLAGRSKVPVKPETVRVFITPPPQPWWRGLTWLWVGLTGLLLGAAIGGVAGARYLRRPSPQVVSGAGPPTATLSVSEDSRRFASVVAECERLREELNVAAARGEADQTRRIFDSMAQMLVQLPTVRRAISEGASVAAGDLVRMLAPLDDALADAGIEPIGEPGATVGYDPTIHQPAGSEPLTISPGGRVRVKFVGYRYHDEILRRAQVGPV